MDLMLKCVNCGETRQIYVPLGPGMDTLSGAQHCPICGCTMR